MSNLPLEGTALRLRFRKGQYQLVLHVCSQCTSLTILAISADEMTPGVQE